MKSTTTVSILLAGMIAAAGVHAQSAAAGGSSNVPLKAGEASTMTNGVPNAKTTNTPGTEGTSATVNTGTAKSTAASTTKVPEKAGEASTMVKGKPNANPDAPQLNKSKAEIKSEKAMKKAEADQRRQTAIMGQTGPAAGRAAGVPATAPAGTPSVQEGGTPQ
jgi:hypothetical protein